MRCDALTTDEKRCTNDAVGEDTPVPTLGGDKPVYFCSTHLATARERKVETHSGSTVWLRD